MTTALLISNQHTDPSRVIGQVITGIGVLGAGVMLARDGVVLGVTSAATIWVLASIKLSLINIAILYGVDLLEEHTLAFSRGVHARYLGRRGRDDRNTFSDR
ncbi:MgtC/SapB family protein [Porticoccus sp.]